MFGETKSDAGSKGPNLVSPYNTTGNSSGQGYAPEATLRDARMTTQTQTRCNREDKLRNTSSATESGDLERDAPRTSRGGLKDAKSRAVVDVPKHAKLREASGGSTCEQLVADTEEPDQARNRRNNERGPSPNMWHPKHSGSHRDATHQKQTETIPTSQSCAQREERQTKHRRLTKTCSRMPYF